MTGRAVTAFVLDCDGCGCSFGVERSHESSTECRGAAYAAGWRFPSRLKKDGSPGRGFVHDVCPECAPTFVPPERSPLRERRP